MVSLLVSSREGKAVVSLLVSSREGKVVVSWLVLVKGK